MSEIAQNCNDCGCAPQLTPTPEGYFLTCPNCGRWSYEKKTIDEAVKQWNREYGWWMQL